MYYQQYNGPLNYELDSSNGLIPLEHNDYPLISVMIKQFPSVNEFSSTTITMLPGHSTSLPYTTLSSSTNTLLSSVSSSSSSIVTITSSPTLSITESITTPLSNIKSSHLVLSTGSISTTEVSRTQNTVSEGNPTSEVFVTSSSSAVTTTSLNTVSMESTPDQSTGSLILAGSISSVSILLVITILVILIVSVLLFRRKQLGTGNTKSDNESITDEHKQG
ncbi:PREDICTED: cell wall integrity and stress response component 4-like [Amphimedon queenslandica]|uniref:Uncharacterized protein n=1 Tax=Amphimedon queenslandica TaxID=400682 RepID=A0AAN0JLJ3_AMPQE|nr:PREDICTED: cell wall integrity and stress response component 4-like [Amphimedon queenslandica]|eukprot:XP_019857853.1 PREDICTED: cell wall integrity and stress response component 4-like [Amphimedon queenslandica]